MKIPFEKVLMDGISDMVFVIKVENEQEFRYEFINKTAMNLLGYSDDILGLTFKEVELEEKAEFLYKHYQQVVNSKTILAYEDSYREKTNLGMKRYSETILTPIFDNQGIVVHIVAVVRDVTKEKTAHSYVNEMVSKITESNERYQSLFVHNTDGIFTLDIYGFITDGNIATESITGYNVKELIGKPFEDLIETMHIPILEEIFEKVGNGEAHSGDLVIQHKNGALLNITIKVIPLVIKEKVIGLFASFKDVTEHIKNIEMLEQSENRFRIIAENAQDLITLINNDGEITYVSPSYQNILGYTDLEYIGKSFVHNIHPDDLRKLVDTIGHSIQFAVPFTVEFRQKNAEGEMIWCESIGNPVFNHKNQFQQLVVLTRDITLRKDFESKLIHFAYHDSLTGLPNRLLFNKRFASAKKQLLTSNEGLAIVMLDIDHFKKINDTYGHDMGDFVIQEFSKRLKQSVRDHDTVARLGGDEFIILLSSIQNTDHAIEIAERIKQKMQQPWEFNNVKLNLTTSMGIAVAPISKSYTKSELIKNADLALYQAKDSGRNSYKVYSK